MHKVTKMRLQTSDKELTRLYLCDAQDYARVLTVGRRSHRAEWDVRLILRRWSSISQVSYGLGSTKQSVVKKAANATVQLWRNRDLHARQKM